MRRAQYPNANCYNGFPAPYYSMNPRLGTPHDPNPTVAAPLNWLRPPFPRGCPYCGMQFMSFYKLGGHMTAHRREMREANRQALVSLAGRNPEMAALQAQGHYHAVRMGAVHGIDAEPPADHVPVVPLGVLEPRVDLGLRCPPTLDLLGLGQRKLQAEDKADDVKAVIDLDQEGSEEDDGSPCCSHGTMLKL